MKGMSSPENGNAIRDSTREKRLQCPGHHPKPAARYLLHAVFRFSRRWSVDLEHPAGIKEASPRTEGLTAPYTHSLDLSLYLALIKSAKLDKSLNLIKKSLRV